jgi:hypothetical protein
MKILRKIACSFSMVGHSLRMSNAAHATKSTHCAMITDMTAKTVTFINALGYTCAMADCSAAEVKGLRAKAIKKADRTKWTQAAKDAGFAVIL